MDKLMVKLEEMNSVYDKEATTKSSARLELDKLKFKSEAFDLVSQYLSDELSEKLRTHVGGLSLQFNSISANESSNEANSNGNSNKRPRM